MSGHEANGRALAARARTAADLSPTEIAEFGSWLLDVMARLIFVHDDTVVAVELKSLARQAFNFHELSAEGQHRLGIWVEQELDRVRGLDRRVADRRSAGRRASDQAIDRAAMAVHLNALDSYFGISASFTGQACVHGNSPPRTCPDADCAARRANVAWDALRT